MWVLVPGGEKDSAETWERSENGSPHFAKLIIKWVSEKPSGSSCLFIS